MQRFGLRDDQWERIKDFLPGREGHVGGNAADNRLFVEAVLYRYRTGIPWRDLPARFGDWKIVHQRFSRWAKSEGLVLTKVPYRDTVQAATDLGEGRIQIYASSYAILRPQTEAGRIKVLAVMGRERAPSLPALPSAAEAGYPALEMEGLVGLFGIKDMSTELREKIAADVIAAARDPAVIARLNATAQTPNFGGPKEFAESIKRQRERIAIIAKAVGIPPKQ